MEGGGWRVKRFGFDLRDHECPGAERDDEVHSLGREPSHLFIATLHAEEHRHADLPLHEPRHQLCPPSLVHHPVQ